MWRARKHEYTMKELNRLIIEDLKDALRSKKLIFSIFLTIFIVLTVSFSDMINLIVFLLVDSPDISFITIPYAVLFFILPFTILLMSYDTFNKDIQERSIRNIITKVKRDSYILSKIISNLIMIIGIIFIILSFMSLYAYIEFNIFIIKDASLVFIYVSILSLLSISFYSFISIIVRRTSFSLYTSLATIIVLAAIDKPMISAISPFRYFIPQTTVSSLALPAFIFTVVSFLLITITIILFRRKDLWPKPNPG